MQTTVHEVQIVAVIESNYLNIEHLREGGQSSYQMISYLIICG